MQTNLTPNQGSYEEITQIQPTPQTHSHISSELAPSKSPKRKFLKYFLVALLLLSVVGILALLVILFEKEIRHHMEALLLWLADHKSRGFFIFLGLQFAGVPVLFPVSLITLTGGFIFSDEFGMIKGILLASIFSFIAIHLGSVISFILSRFCCGSFIQKCCINRFKLTRALDRGFQEHGIKLVSLMRLSFMVPNNIFNYVMGTTSISLYDFTLGSLALFLNVAVEILIGASVSSISDIIQGKYHGSLLFEIVLIFGFIMAFIMIIVIAKITRAQFRKLTRQEKNDELGKQSQEVQQPDQY